MSEEFLGLFFKKMFFFYKKLVFEKKEFVISKRILEESLFASYNMKNCNYSEVVMNLQKLDFWLSLLKLGRFCEVSKINECLEYSDFIKALVKQ